MDWDKLYAMQKQLDTYIEKNHSIEGQDIFSKKFLALLVELGELANETRCFKFWSHKPPSDQQDILEEYVDGLHFILSLGLEKGFQFKPETERERKPNEPVTNLFIALFHACNVFGDSPEKRHYTDIINIYLTLGNALGFDEGAVEAMYVEKNTVNYRRQDEGY